MSGHVKNNPKICLVGSSGGHLTQLYDLKDWWQSCPHFWVTFKKEDATSLLEGESVEWCHYPTNRNFRNLVRNLALALKILRRERPDVVISTGAGAAVPFFWIAKMLRIRTVFIEVYDRISNPTLTGRMVYPIADLFVVQWDELKTTYPKAVNIGRLF